MKLNNMQIYNAATTLVEVFNKKDIYLPAKINFYIQKNIEKISAAAEAIEKARVETIRHYGILNENNNQYDIPEDKQKIAFKELDDLFSIEQDIDIKMLPIDDIALINLTLPQMNSIMFMIEE